MFYVDTNQHISEITWTGSQFLIGDLTAAGGGLPVAPGGGVSGYLASDGQHILYMDTNNHLSQIWWTGSQLVAQDLTSASHRNTAPTTATKEYIYLNGKVIAIENTAH